MDSAVNCEYVLQTDNDGVTLLIRSGRGADKLPSAVFRIVRHICDPVVLVNDTPACNDRYVWCIAEICHRAFHVLICPVQIVDDLRPPVERPKVAALGPTPNFRSRLFAVGWVCAGTDVPVPDSSK